MWAFKRNRQTEDKRVGDKDWDLKEDIHIKIREAVIISEVAVEVKLYFIIECCAG